MTLDAHIGTCDTRAFFGVGDHNARTREVSARFKKTVTQEKRNYAEDGNEAKFGARISHCYSSLPLSSVRPVPEPITSRGFAPSAGPITPRSSRTSIRRAARA